MDKTHLHNFKLRDLNVFVFSIKSHVPSSLVTQSLPPSKISSVNRMLGFALTMLVV